MMKRLIAMCGTLCLGAPAVLAAQGDRGTGIRTSMIETYVEPHQLLVYPFVATSRDHDFEYQPSWFGQASIDDFRGRYRTSEAALFLAYGVSDWLAVELEGSHITGTFERAANDTTGTPAQVRESAVADIGGQVRLRLAPERGSRPEFFMSVEVLPPIQSSLVLIGEPRWDVRSEVGAVRGYRWGTMTFRTTIEYNHDDASWELGETSLEYLRQLSPAWRILAGIEGGEGGAPDDYSLVTAAHWRLASGIQIKAANYLGLQSKATDWEFQLGLLVTSR